MKFFDKFKDDWQIKLLAFFLAVLLWAYVVKINHHKNDNTPRQKTRASNQE